MYFKRLIIFPLAAFLHFTSTTISPQPAAQTVFIDQGDDWTRERRSAFYTQDQGSRIMPMAWIQALKTDAGEDFLYDSLTRYGYLPNPSGTNANLPVGFTLAGNPASIGMTCSACHTRQIDVGSTPYRIDGGPGIVDFQNFLADLDVAMGRVLIDEASFDTFADAVLGSSSTDTAKAELKIEAELWYLRFNTLVTRSLPDPAWGPSRLDAVSMIFNRLAGLDIGSPPSYIIAENIAKADAPTRYPFLWNAARQDKTQWPGFADNGNDLLGLARNLGEVFGVFGTFHPTKQSGLFKLNRDYTSNNSANFDGLKRVENLIKDIGPPKWQWELDATLVAQGEELFNKSPEDGGCVACHGITRGSRWGTWGTPVQDVGTDTAECRILKRTVDTGIMSGAKIPVLGLELKPQDTAFNLLSVSVIGSIIQDYLSFGSSGSDVALTAQSTALPDGMIDDLSDAFRRPDSAALTTGGCKYEARVLQGIWAAAPYLHNGSVATLEDLLKPATERQVSFKIGPNYDINTVGLAVEQDRFGYTLNTTGCDDLDSGNSRCGHEYGTGLSDADRRSLLEYLKAL